MELKDPLSGKGDKVEEIEGAPFRLVGPVDEGGPRHFPNRTGAAGMVLRADERCNSREHEPLQLQRPQVYRRSAARALPT